MKKIISVILICIIAFLSFVSCGDSKKNPETDKGEKAVPVSGGTLKLACVSPDTMNPIVTTHASVSDFLSLIYEGLFVLKPDLTVEGVLAKDYSVSANNTVYTIKLKDNIKFHSGKIFTAHDVVSTLNYMALYSTRFKSFTQYIAGYMAEDNNTLVIKLNSPKADFVNNLDFPVLPQGLMSEDFNAQNSSFVPNGTGMYEYTTTESYKNIKLTANDEWHGGKRPYIDNVDIEILSDEETIISAFDAGAIDAITTSWKGFGELELTSSLFNTFEYEQNKFTYVGINCQHMYFDTAPERRLLKTSIDSDKITQDIMLGHAVVASSPLRDKAYYNLEQDNEDSFKEDIGKLPHGEFRLLYNSDSKTKSRIAQTLKQQLESAGYGVILDGQAYSAYCDKVAVGDYDLYIGEVLFTGSCDMQFMFSSPMGGLCNYDDSELRALVDNLDIVTGSEEKKTAWENFERYYANAAIQIPLYFTNGASFISKRFGGSMKPNLSSSYYGLNNMSIKNN